MFKRGQFTVLCRLLCNLIKDVGCFVTPLYERRIDQSAGPRSSHAGM